MIHDALRLLWDFLTGGDPTYNSSYPQLLGLATILSHIRDLILTILGF